MVTIPAFAWRGALNNDIVAYLLRARTVEPEKQPLPTNGS
jgi:hypothetical protein